MTQNQVDEEFAVAAAQFTQVALSTLVRAEASGRMPERFTEKGQQVWRAFRNELTVANLAEIAIQDAGMVMPLPFDPASWWPGWPDGGLRNQKPEEVQGWLATALDYAQESSSEYLHRQAQRLNLSLASQAQLDLLPTPAAHEQWLELPGTGGWVAYNLCQRGDATLYLWENFTIVCTTPQEMLFAGLVAWELGAPPNQSLPISLDGPDLAGTLQAGRTYDDVVGVAALHRHRDLSLLHKKREDPRWIK